MSYEEQDHEDGDVVASSITSVMVEHVTGMISRLVQLQLSTRRDLRSLTDRVYGLERVTSKGHGIVPVFGCECVACNALRFRDGPSVEATAPPAPGADEPAGDAFVDATDEIAALREQNDRLGARVRYLHNFMTNCKDVASVEAEFARDYPPIPETKVLARAAALPARSAPAPVTITRAQFGAAWDAYREYSGRDGDGHRVDGPALAKAFEAAGLVLDEGT